MLLSVIFNCYYLCDTYLFLFCDTYLLISEILVSYYLCITNLLLSVLLHGCPVKVSVYILPDSNCIMFILCSYNSVVNSSHPPQASSRGQEISRKIKENYILLTDKQTNKHSTSLYLDIYGDPTEPDTQSWWASTHNQRKEKSARRSHLTEDDFCWKMTFVRAGQMYGWDLSG